MFMYQAGLVRVGGGRTHQSSVVKDKSIQPDALTISDAATMYRIEYLSTKTPMTVPHKFEVTFGMWGGQKCILNVTCDILAAPS
jgi:hypothetical protein